MSEEILVVDKTAWPRGEWDNEPDKVQWITKAGLDGLIVRQPRAGHLCGYVGVPPEHPWHGIDYGGCTHKPSCVEGYCDHSPEAQIGAHGGLTYSDACQEDGTICHVPERGRPADVWWFGFDFAHLNDLSPGRAGHYRLDEETYKPIRYVRAEVERVAKQLAAVR